MKRQGYLYWGNVPDGIASGKRPYLVLSTDQANTTSVIVAPLASIKSSVPTNVTISKEWYPIKDGSIMLNDICTIKKEYLQEEICALRDEEYIKVKEILKLLFSI